MDRIIRVGTRKSLLALVQTQLVVDKLYEKFPDLKIEIITMSTKGDERLDKELSSFGGKGVFTKELEEGLLSGAIDMAVHSAKDMPVELPEGLIIGAVPGRADVHDMFVMCSKSPYADTKLENLPEGFAVGTGSLRRALQIQALNPGLIVKPIRGNVQTRLNKLGSGEYDAIILAKAGITRLLDDDHRQDVFDYDRFIYKELDVAEMLPAAGQGILAVEARDGDLTEILSAITCEDARIMLEAERSFLCAIGGSCNAPAAALASIEGKKVHMKALYAPDGKRMKTVTGCAEITEAAKLGENLARQLLCGKVCLIGAGPGDEGLMTQKGLRALKEADVVIYDSLAASSLLNEVRDDAKLLYAGKRAGSHYLKQDETNALIVKYAMEGKTVARLKGGDPFIFGRGGEEGLALADAGIDFEVIPGISSSYAVAAYQGIPVTHRTMASSFHVITGHEDAAKNVSVLDYATLAKEEGTLVFLMGLKNLGNISSSLIEHGKDPKTPAAVMQEGTTAHQKMAVGPLCDIADIARQQGIKTPAITLVGDVVSLHESLAWYSKKPLAGSSVLVTATKAMADEFGDRLEALGAQAMKFSLIQTMPIQSDAVEAAYGSLKDYQWIVFTSKNGVETFFEGLKVREIDIRSLGGVKFAVIGDGTAKALKDYGIFCDYMPVKFSSSDMARSWVPTLAGSEHILLLRAREASTKLTDALTAAGIDFNAVALYETREDMRKSEELERMLPLCDYVTFCSASAVKAFAHMYTHDLSKLAAKVICIGPVTSNAARELGFNIYKTASCYNIEGMIECLTKIGDDN